MIKLGKWDLLDSYVYNLHEPVILLTSMACLYCLLSWHINPVGLSQNG